tara:strand:- start:2 stop:352 length:351 start_codon:yes stop_codon:yes gene_type:complete
MVSFEDWLVVKLPPPLKLVPADNVIVALFGLDPLLTVCQVLSPLRNLFVIDEPLPNLAAATVPKLILSPFKVVKLEPTPINVEAVTELLNVAAPPPAIVSLAVSLVIKIKDLALEL